MRLSVIGSLGSMIFHGEAAPSSSARNLMRPHIRFMIQSVSESGPQSFSEYKFALVEEGKYCQAASSLLTADKKESLPLFGASSEITQRGAISTRKYLHSLGDEMRKEDLRRAVDMKYIWEGSIVLEVGKIMEAVESNLHFHGRQAAFAKELHGAAITHAKENVEKNIKYESHLFVHEGVFKSHGVPSVYDLESKHEASVKGDPKNHLNGVLSHSLEDWWSIKNHHGKSEEELNFLLEILGYLEGEMKKMFDEHLTDIQTGRDYFLKWTPDASADDSEKYSPERRLSEVTGEEKKSVGSTDYKISDIVEAFDSFGSEEAGKLGSKIVELLATPIVPNPPHDGQKNFQDFLNVKGSPAETMDRLTTLLNALQMQRLGLFDARLSLNKLKGKISEVGVENRENLLISKTVMEVDLKNIDPLAKVVYEDLERYPKNGYGVKLDDEANKDAYDTYKKEVNEARGENAIKEVHPRINLLANVARRVHGHMLGFLEILGTTTSVVSPPAGPLTDEKKQSVEDARSASNCLLYGRYDVLMRYLKLFFNENMEKIKQVNEAENAWCGSTHQAGLKNLKGRIKTPSGNGDEDAEKKIGVKPSSKAVRDASSVQRAGDKFATKYETASHEASAEEFFKMKDENALTGPGE